MVMYGQHLMRSGHTVRIISPPLQPTPLARKLRFLVTGKGWPYTPKRPQSHIDGSGIDHQILDRWRPVTEDDVPDGDVVIATWWETAEWVNALGPRKGAKVYFIQHHEIFPYLPTDRCKATYRMPLHKIVVAKWLQGVMKAQYGDDTVDLVPNSVDRNQFFAPHRGKQARPTVGVLYATAPGKGLHVSLSALRLVGERFPDLRVISFGSEGPIKQLPLPANAEFFFRPPQDQIRSLYAQCDAWITASLSEGFNLPAMEAMACRTPVISTKTGWPEEAITTSVNGMLVEVDDTAGMAKAIEWVLSLNDLEWRQLSENACATVASCSSERSAELFERALRHACDRSAIAGQCAQAATPYPPVSGVSTIETD
jgi:glycosyltransferase involved in cell wall biosynthesis